MFLFFVYALGVFVTRCIWYASIPFMAIYLYNNATKDSTIIGLILGGGTLLACISSLYGSIYVDKFTPKNIMVLMLSLLATCFIWLYYSRATNLFMFFIINSLIGSCVAIFEIASKTHISLSPLLEKQKVQMYNLRYLLSNFAAMVGPYVGVWFTKYSYHKLFILIAIMYALTFILFFLFLNNIGYKNQKSNLKIQIILNTIIHDKVLYLITILSFINFWSMSQLEIILPQILNHRVHDYTEIFASILIINAAIVILLSMPFSMIVYKFNHIILAYISSICYFISFVIFAFAYTKPILFLAIIIYTFGEIIYATLINIFLDKISAKHMNGVYFGVMRLGMLGVFFGSIIEGAILKKFGGTTSFIFASIVMISSIICYSKISKLIQYSKGNS